MILPADPNVQSEPAEDAEAAVGTIVADRYRILDVAGHGGMGVVYKAQHIHMSRTCALKMLLREACGDNQAFRRFQQEARAASLLSHPHIVGIHDFGLLSENQAYLAMDFLDGTSLYNSIREEGALELDRFRHIFTQACDALAHAHRHGVVHRDIKPSNLLLVDRDGDKDFLVIVDFGLVKLMSSNEDQRLTSTDMLVGSPLYMSPEQCRGLPVDNRTDIYSLGCVMYEALTGFAPLAGATPLDTLYKHVAEAPPAMNVISPSVFVPPAVEAVIMKALSKDPAKRQQSMEELQQNLLESMAPGAVPIKTSMTHAVPALNASAPTASTPTQERTSISAIRSKVVAQQRKPSIWLWLGPVLAVTLVSAVIIGSLVRVILQQDKTIAQEEKPAVSVAPVAAVKPVAPPVVSSPVVPKQAKHADAHPMHHDEKAAELARQQRLEDKADDAYDGQRWKEARNFYEQSRAIEIKLFGSDAAHLVPILGKLTVCARRMNDDTSTVEYFNQFADVYDDHPDEIKDREALLLSLSEISSELENKALATKLLWAGIAAHDEKLSRPDVQSFQLRLALARLEYEAKNVSDAEQQLRQIIDQAMQFPAIRMQAAKSLVGILRTQGRQDDIRQFVREHPFLAGADEQNQRWANKQPGMMQRLGRRWKQLAPN